MDSLEDTPTLLRLYHSAYKPLGQIGSGYLPVLVSWMYISLESQNNAVHTVITSPKVMVAVPLIMKGVKVVNWKGRGSKGQNV